MNSEDNLTSSDNEIFENCSTTSGGESSANSLISSVSMPIEKFSIDTTSSQSNKSSIHISPVLIDATIKNKSHITSPEDTTDIESKTSSVKESSSFNHPTHSSTKIDTQISPRIINATTDSQNNKSSINNSTDFVDSTIKNISQITSPEDNSAIMNIEPNKSTNQGTRTLRIQMGILRKMKKNKNLEEDNASNEDHTEKKILTKKILLKMTILRMKILLK